MKTPVNRLPHHMQTCLVFAARYAHHRNTGGALAICTAIRDQWTSLDKHTQDQILRESHEATANLDDWQKLRDSAAILKP